MLLRNSLILGVLLAQQSVRGVFTLACLCCSICFIFLTCPGFIFQPPEHQAALKIAHPANTFQGIYSLLKASVSPSYFWKQRYNRTKAGKTEGLSLSAGCRRNVAILTPLWKLPLENRCCICFCWKAGPLFSRKGLLVMEEREKDIGEYEARSLLQFNAGIPNPGWY